MPYTNLPDKCIRTLGLRDAFVLCLVYRHCQMKENKFSSSIPKRSKSLGLGRNTLRRALHRLRDNGYIRDLTPDRQHEPHNYDLTTKGLKLLDSQSGSPRSGVPDQESQLETPKMGVKEYSPKSTLRKSTPTKKVAVRTAATGQMTLIENHNIQNLGGLDIEAQKCLVSLGIRADIEQKQNAPAITRGRTPAEVLMFHDENNAISKNLDRWRAAWDEKAKMPWKASLIWWKICEGQAPPEPETEPEGVPNWLKGVALT